MADLKFGAAGFNKPTPKTLKIVFNTFLYLSGAWIFIAPAFNLAQPVLNLINKDLLTGLALMKFTISFFHYDYEIQTDTPSTNTQIIKP